MFVKKILPHKCHLMTWEFATQFDAVPTEKILQEAFFREMPLTAKALGKRTVKFWHMISFNSQEGRLSRYLVVIPDEEIPSGIGRIRYVPKQLGLYGIADNVMRLEECADNSGNFLFWSIRENILHILVFLEGRLCHWSEESGYMEEGVALREWIENRLMNFREFLKQDSLFSRGESFEEREIAFEWDERIFRQSARDSFFRKLNLNDEISAAESRRISEKGILGLLVILVACGLYLYFEYFQNEVPDVLYVAPVELLEPPISECVLEEKVPVDSVLNAGGEKFRNELHQNDRLQNEQTQDVQMQNTQVQMPVDSIAEPPCHLPSFRIKGIVGGRIAMVEGLPKSFVSRGDSLGDFVIQSVGRDRITVACREMLQEVLVR